ncbi:MAG: DUF3500 domain-containing protein [Myxococcota bacterium]
MRRRALWLGIVLAGAFGAVALADTEADTLGHRAAAWLASLDSDQRRAARYEWEDDERFDLRLAPIGLEGVRRRDLDDSQWRGLRHVLAGALSEQGLAKVETIMSLEREVRRRDRESLLGGWFGGFIHGEDLYYTSVYGEPDAGTPWGLRFDGHHVSLNWTVDASGRVSTTPFFLGGEPREVPADWERAGLRVLADEEDRGGAVLAALTAEQRAASELPFTLASGIAGNDRAHFLGEGARVDASEPAGVAYAGLGPAAQAAVDALLEAYLANFAAPLATQHRAAVDAGGRGRLHFAWSGSLAPGAPGYYRLQGPDLLIEFDNTMEAADHVHLVVRRFDGDFGRDLLAEHHARHHTPHRSARADHEGLAR